MSESMVERVARAIGRVNMPSVEWADLMDVERDFFTEEARAAIAAMREPPKAILEMAAMTEIKSPWVADLGNGRDEPVTFPIVFALHEIGWKEANVAVAAIWGEMIDAALSEPKGE